MTVGIVLKKPRARIDLAACYGYLGERSLDSARRFRLAAEATFSALAATPGVGEPYETDDPRLAGLRCARVKRFGNYLVFYRPIPGGIEVIRVLHAARDVRGILKTEGS
ncbi:MAG: type II toxin-antitoxin system RelE/ParE family toxin [Isosphaeraceae bacterium]